MKKLIAGSITVLGLVFWTPTYSHAEEIGEIVRHSTMNATLKLTKVLRRHGVVSVKADGELPQRSCSKFSSMAGSYLLDPEKGTKYMILKDEKGAILGSPEFEVAKCEGPFGVYAKFPAPPAEIKSIDIVLNGFQPFEDVPIEDK